MSTRAPQFYDFLHFKGCSYLDPKISFNLSVEVAIFLVFHDPFMMLFHILMSVSDHELMLDNFLLRSSVLEEVLCFISIFPKADFSGHKLLVEKFHDPEYCPNPCCGLARKVQGSLWLFCQFLSENLTLQIF